MKNIIKTFVLTMALVLVIAAFATCEFPTPELPEAPCTHEGTEEILSGKAATCTEAGLTEGEKCSVCGTVIVAQEEIAALGHKEETLPAKAATCTATGLTEGKNCSVCGTVTVAQKETPLGGHTWDNAEATVRTCTVCGLTELTTSEGVNDAIGGLESGDSIVMPGGQISLPTLSEKTGVTIQGAADGSTVIGGKDSVTGFGGNFGADNTFKNLTFSGSNNGVRYSYGKGGTVVFENCTFAGDSLYGFHMDESNGATIIFNNCTFKGFNAFAGDLVKVVFNNCTFLHNEYYGHTNIWSVGEFNNCTWGDKASVSTAGESAKLYFNGVEESYHHEFIGSAESLIAFEKSVNEGNDSWSGQKVILVADIDLENVAWTPIGQTGATEFRGIFDGQAHTIYNLNVDNTSKEDAYTSSGLFGWAESGVTIQNVKVDGATVKGNHNVAVIVGYTYSGVIKNCHVTNATVVCKHANDDACGDKAGTIVGYAGTTAQITDCSASDSTVTAGRDAGQLIGAGYSTSVSGCTAENVTVTAGGDCTDEKNINNNVIGRVLD